MSIEIVDFRSSSASKVLVDSLSDSGFAVLVNHDIDKSVFAELYRQWAEFFASPDKKNFLMTKGANSGFVPTQVAELPRSSGARDIKEFYDYVVNGKCPEGLKKITSDYYNIARSLSLTLLQWLQAGIPKDLDLSLGDSLDALVAAGGNVLLRIIHYPALTGAEEKGAVRAAEHADTNFITLLPTATSQGLQVRLKDGSWVDVPNVEGSIVINCGDMLSHATQGFYKSAYHRVLNPDTDVENKSRISMPMFVHPHPSAVLSQQHTAASFFEETAAQVLLGENED